MKLNPLTDQVVIKHQKKEYTGAIHMLTEELSNEGTVMSVGPGYICEATGELIPMTLVEGDKVLYPAKCGEATIIGDGVFVIIRERDVFGVLAED